MSRPSLDTRWEAGELARRLMPDMARLTDTRIGEAALANARANSAWLDRGRSIATLRGENLGKSPRAVIVVVGPSLTARFR